ncbi:hypothetical protein ROZALSC1DRAFT_23246 [Rozella allomycis CSF55]|uniref:Uncharacterized protein n=1 Tax=Rozella allomycis (strain CSF55) TaxID=988480 RepID=A0A4P9YGL2_ROZAC|nr:hypothetical protein ROZALSC1DRAFT_23246 [Rozella allomycis CSF55]
MKLIALLVDLILTSLLFSYPAGDFDAPDYLDLVETNLDFEWYQNIFNMGPTKYINVIKSKNVCFDTKAHMLAHAPDKKTQQKIVYAFESVGKGRLHVANLLLKRAAYFPEYKNFAYQILNSYRCNLRIRHPEDYEIQVLIDSLRGQYAFVYKMQLSRLRKRHQEDAVSRSFEVFFKDSLNCQQIRSTFSKLQKAFQISGSEDVEKYVSSKFRKHATEKNCDVSFSPEVDDINYLSKLSDEDILRQYHNDSQGADEDFNEVTEFFKLLFMICDT